MWSFFGSQISGLVGSNPFDSQTKSILQVWKKHCPDAVEAAYKRLQNVGQLEEDRPPVLETIINADEKIKTELTTAIASEDQVVRQQAVQGVVDHIVGTRKDVSIVHVEDLISQVKSHVNTARGIRDEEKGVEMYSTNEHKKVGERNSKFYKSYLYASWKGRKVKYMIGGRVDGITEDGILLEVKNRQRRLLGRVPDHENVQIQIYMYLLGITECHLVECYKTTTQKHIVYYDNELVTSILEELERVALLLDHLSVCQSSQDNLLTTDGPLVWCEQHMSEDVNQDSEHVVEDFMVSDSPDAEL